MEMLPFFDHGLKAVATYVISGPEESGKLPRPLGRGLRNQYTPPRAGASAPA